MTTPTPTDLPEALRLADALDCYGHEGMSKAAAELRRLYALSAAAPAVPALWNTERMTDQAVTPAFSAWLDAHAHLNGVGANEAWNAGVAHALAAPKAPQEGAPAELTVTACYFPGKGEADLTWTRNDTGDRFALTVPVTDEQGKALSNVVYPCLNWSAAAAQPQAGAESYPPRPDLSGDSALWIAIGKHRNAVASWEIVEAASNVDDAVMAMLKAYADATAALRAQQHEQDLTVAYMGGFEAGKAESLRARGAVPSGWPYHELRFIMRVLSHKGGAPKQDWDTAYGMARSIFERWHSDALRARGAVPSGWKLVPVEPNDAMVAAAYKGGFGGGPAADYLAMLAAAPAAPMSEKPSNCQRCSGSGEDPEGFYDQSRGPDGDTHDGPCRTCGGTGAAPMSAQGAPEGYEVVFVNGFDDLMTCLHYNNCKGDMPANTQEAWDSFDYRKPETSATAAPAAKGQEGGAAA